MFRAMIRRTLLSVLILFLVAVFVFLATEVLPGDALDVYLSEDDVMLMTQEDIEEIERPGANHLRSCDEIDGYTVSANDEDSGHICDFIIDKHNWQVTLFIVDSRDWLPGGKKVALSTAMIKDIDWSAHKVNITLSHEVLKALPEVDDERLDDSDYLTSLVNQAQISG